MDSITKQITSPSPASRRQVLKRLGLSAAGLTGINLLSSVARGQTSAAGNAGSSQDVAILQFALNLEHLEAEFYAYATTGQGTKVFPVRETKDQ